MATTITSNSSDDPSDAIKMIVAVIIRARRGRLCRRATRFAREQAACLRTVHSSEARLDSGSATR